MRLLERSVFWELIRVFAALLSALTVFLVLGGVFTEARTQGLGAVQILQILPYVVPSLLPFTIPATLLLTVCVVYGRMAGDLEVIASRAAGISTMKLLWPSFFLASLMSCCTFMLTDQFIPWARSHIQETIILAMEQIVLDELRSQSQFLDPRNGVMVTVMGVREKTLIDPVFRIQPPGGALITIQADEANMEFNPVDEEVSLRFRNAYIYTKAGGMWAEEHREIIRLPRDNRRVSPRDLSIHSIRYELGEISRRRTELNEQRVIALAMNLTLADFRSLTETRFRFYEMTLKQLDEREIKLLTEIHSRVALACSCFFFVLLGSPISILLAQRNFLTTFFFCFLPIVVVYYPLTMLCIRLSQSYSLFHPSWTMWGGNLLLFLAGSTFLHRVLRN